MSVSNGVTLSPSHTSLKRSQSDTNSDQINVHSISSGSDIGVVNHDANYPDGRSKIAKMSSIHPQCQTIGGIYNVQTSNVILLCDTTTDDMAIPAHKSILAADSTVFYQQFYVESRTFNTFRIVNTTPDMLCKFLQSFYGKSMKMRRTDLPELMQLAYDFDAGKCKEICHEFMHKSLDAGIDDVLGILELALVHNYTPICNRCIEKIHRFGDFLIETDEFLTCNRQVFKLVVSNDFVRRNEKKLFGACIEWAKRRIGTKTSTSYKEIRREIGKCFQMIHFDLMSAVQFVECLSEFTVIFQADEIQEISKMILERREFDHPSNGDFNVMAQDQRENIPRGRLFTIRHIFANRLNDFRKLYNDNVSADMHFVFETNDVRIAAHKCILATRSSIFEKRLYEINGPVEVLVKSTSPRTFSAFLKLLYGYRIDEIVQKTNLDAILTLAYEYSVLDIGKGQENQLKQFVTLETLFWAANLCQKFRFIDSMSFNCKWIRKHAKKFDLNLAFHSTALVHCSRTIVQNALDIDYHNQNAMRVFEAVINWAKNRCQQSKSKSNSTPTTKNLRRKLNNLLQFIPFHKMTRPQFDACQHNYPGLLNEMEIRDVLATMTLDSDRNIDDVSRLDGSVNF